MVLFLNSLTHFEYLVQNKYFHHFITDSDKNFKNFKTQANVVKLTADIGSIENLDGKFKV